VTKFTVVDVYVLNALKLTYKHLIFFGRDIPRTLVKKGDRREGGERREGEIASWLLGG